MDHDRPDAGERPGRPDAREVLCRLLAGAGALLLLVGLLAGTVRLLVEEESAVKEGTPIARIE